MRLKPVVLVNSSSVALQPSPVYHSSPSSPPPRLPPLVHTPFPYDAVVSVLTIAIVCSVTLVCVIVASIFRALSRLGRYHP